MRNTYLIFALVIGSCFTSLGQNLNSYKYISIPEKFDFLKESNQYQMNDLSKFLFEKYGFTVFMDGGSKPLDLSLNPCNVLYATILDDSGLFETKLQLVLRNCENQEVFVSKIGSSREKDYKTAYQQALRDAFSSFDTINYSYNENSEKNIPLKTIVNAPKPSVEKVVEEVVVTAIPTKSNSTQSEVSGSKTMYVSGNLEVYLLRSDYGFQVFQKEMEEPFAKLIKTGSATHFIYSTLDNNGIAFFDANGNLNVETLVNNENSTSLKIYKLKN
tara:strand:- start:1755 stop:2573 length:819 start_codon:yes stop_codon:yes gene_type:complete